MGAAGRDFHDFATFFRENPRFRVRCFTAHQIPFIDQRSFPKELAGPGYEEDIPIHLEAELSALIDRYDVDIVCFSYSDVSHEEVMHRASIVQAAGASFMLLGPKHTELHSSCPVVSVTAVRTGAGKSPLSQALASHLVGRGLRAGVIRHPMPYGDLRLQLVQRFATAEDLDTHDCTVEEREEYEPYVARGLTIFAGVDYAAILAAAEKESDVILWDGGNNDTPFIKPNLRIVIADALRAGHEMAYYPGETNFRSADVLIINKVGEASADAVQLIRKHAEEACPSAAVLEADLEVEVSDPAAVRGRRVLVVEDGPTVTHGGMSFGAGMLAARRYGASEIIDAREHAVGSIAEAYEAYPHMDRVLPALGYSEEQRAQLKSTIERAAPDVVLDASPARVARLLSLDLPILRVGYSFKQLSGRPVFELVDEALAAARA